MTIGTGAVWMILDIFTSDVPSAPHHSIRTQNQILTQQHSPLSVCHHDKIKCAASCLVLGCLVASAGGSIGDSDVGASFREENQVSGEILTRYGHTNERDITKYNE